MSQQQTGTDERPELEQDFKLKPEGLNDDMDFATEAPYEPSKKPRSRNRKTQNGPMSARNQITSIFDSIQQKVNDDRLTEARGQPKSYRSEYIVLKDMYATKKSECSKKDYNNMKIYSNSSNAGVTSDTSIVSPRTFKNSPPKKDIYHRNTKWQTKKNQTILKAKALQEKQIDKQLTFKPEINSSRIEKAQYRRIKRVAAASPKKLVIKDQKKVQTQESKSIMVKKYPTQSSLNESGKYPDDLKILSDTSVSTAAVKCSQKYYKIPT